jgi:hypothetical protein
MADVPQHVAQAAKIVDDWLRQQGQPPAVGNSPPVAKLSDAEKLNRARQYDQTKMPAWKDPRTA